MIYFQASTVVGDSIRRWRINSELIMKLRSGESGERLPLSWDFFWLHSTDFGCVRVEWRFFFLVCPLSSKLSSSLSDLSVWWQSFCLSLGPSSSQVVSVLVSLRIRYTFLSVLANRLSDFWSLSLSHNLSLACFLSSGKLWTLFFSSYSLSKTFLFSL